MRKRPTRLLRALCLALPTLVVATLFAPTLLSTQPLRPLTELLLVRGSSLTARSSSIDLSWFGPTELEELVITRRDSHREPLLEASRARLNIGLLGMLRGDSVTEWAADGVCLNLRQGGGGPALEELLAGWTGVSVSNGSVRIRTSLANDFSRLDNIELALIRGAAGIESLRLEGQSEGPAGKGAFALSLALTHEPEAVLRLDLATRNLLLSDFDPLWRALHAEASLAGACNLDLNLTAGSSHLDLTANGIVQNLELAGIPGCYDGGIRAARVELGGGCTLDLTVPSASFRGFELSSSLLFLEADGSAAPEGGLLVGDLTARAGIDLQRAATRAAPLLRRLLPALHVGGNLEATLRPAEAGGFRLVANGEGINSRLTSRRQLTFGQVHLETDLLIGEGTSSIQFERTNLSFPFASLSGRGALLFRDEAAPVFTLAASIRTDTERSMPIVAQALGWASYPRTAGEVNAQLELEFAEEGATASLGVDSDDFDLRFDPAANDAGASYRFRARPLQTRLKADWSPSAPLDSLTGSGTLTTENCSFGRDSLVDVELEGHVTGRSLRLAPVIARTPKGGELQGTLALHFPADGSRSIQADILGGNLEFTPFTTRLAALCTPIFTFEKYPWNLSTTARIEGRLQLEAKGDGLHDYLRTVQGSGELAFSAGTVSGSPLLDRLIPPRGARGPKNFSGGESRFVVRAGRLEVETSSRWPSQEISFRGDSTTAGRIDFALPANCLFDDLFLREHGSLIPAGCLWIRGGISSPEIQLPDPKEWLEAAREGELPRAVRRLISR